MRCEIKYCPFCSKKISRYATQCKSCSNKNRECSKETRALLSSGRKGANNPNWKGDKVTMVQLHTWVNKNNNKPKICETCSSDKNIDLANVTGNYQRDFINWKYLCRKCHMIEDGRMFKLNELVRQGGNHRAL